jgi:putative membrane protein
MALMMIVFWGALAWVVVTLIRSSSSWGGATPRQHEPSRPSAEDILHERFARGEISVDEYHERLEALRGKRPS